MTPRIAQQPARPGAFRPALLLETVPWLMLAAALRVVVYNGGIAAFPAEIGANAAIFIALLLCTRRMVEFTGGTTQIGYTPTHWSFGRNSLNFLVWRIPMSA